MEKDKQENEGRDAGGTAEMNKKDGVFTKLCTMMHDYGGPVNEQSTTSPKKEEDPETSEEKLSCKVTIQNYGDFIEKIVKSLDGFLILMNTEGVILYVAENIFPLLGLVPSEVVGKKLLSFLPDHEKRPIHKKITISLPLHNSGKNIEFCCHFKRGSVEPLGAPAYEYVKFIVSLNDIFHAPFVFLGGFSLNPITLPTMEEIAALPLDEKYYFIGTVCVIKSGLQQELRSLKEASEETSLERSMVEEWRLVAQDSTEDQAASYRMDPVSTDSTDNTMHIQYDNVGAEEFVILNEDLDDVNTVQKPSSISGASLQVSTPDMTEFSQHLDNDEQKDNDKLPATSSPKWHSKLQFDKNQEEKSQDSFISSSVSAFSTFQGPASLPTDSSQPSSFTLVPVKPSLKRTLSNVSKGKRLCQSSSPAAFRLVEAQGAASSQVLDQEPRLQRLPPVDQQVSLQQPPQQLVRPMAQESLAQQLARQPAVARSDMLQLFLPSRAGLQTPFYRNPAQVTHTSPFIVPVRVIQDADTEQQPSARYPDGNSVHHAGENYSFIAGQHIRPSLNPDPQIHLWASSHIGRAHSGSPVLTGQPSSSFAQSSNRPRSASGILETPQNYMQLWHQASELQRQLFFRMDPWPTRRQTALHNFLLRNQAQAYEAAAQAYQASAAFQAPEVFQDPAGQQPNQATQGLSEEQSDQLQGMQYFPRLRRQL